MRQKYVISLDNARNKLKISEYAVIDKNFRRVASSMLKKGSFSFLCEETYDSKIIEGSISEGLKALIATIRTRNIFPIEPYAAKIAEAIMNLYNNSRGDSVELFFDDVEMASA